ncbi:MAG: GNAT family N-acetyltransferase [Deltaproteobacteria bacterium]|jgi:GNAT superfamily N-acetyltransferase|nr:GNAT family N-acetyltransferase [Deltaproteobacteria bacterium]MBT4527102.1 GNAT family N-acetyltransferase [Deltaproteobacteria bacterium]
MTDITIKFRKANIDDVSSIVQMLADDPLGAKREKFEVPLPASYIDAFNSVNEDPNNELIIAETNENDIAGFMQVTFIPYLTYQGKWRALIEGVRVNKKNRSQGIGKQLFQRAIQRAKDRNCHLLQLTTDKQRPDAIKFYESLGFTASHEGMKFHF